jgi:hypothetical protein
MRMYVCDQYEHVGKETSRERVGRSSQGGVGVGTGAGRDARAARKGIVG